MTEKRYKVHNMIKGMNIGESVDLELMKELTEKYGAYEYVDVGITNNGKEMTYKEVVELLNENEQLKNENKRLQILNTKLETKDYTNLIKELKKRTEENMQLKQELNSFKPVVFQDTTNNGTILLYTKEYGDGVNDR